MKVLDLRCSHGHAFEGWFGSDDAFGEQQARGLVECPLCGDRAVTRMPSAPRLNLSGAREPAAAVREPGPPPSAPASAAGAAPAPDAAQVQAQWLRAVRQMLARTEDVGERFPEEARRIHYGEVPVRGIRGRATPEQREALREEGIEVVALPVPAALDGPLQ
jgi:hypothetical protein